MNAARSLTLHAMSFLYPLWTLAFLLTAPHPWYVAPAWLAAMGVLVLVDHRSRADAAAPPPLPRLPFDALLVGLAAIQIANLLLALRVVSHLPLLSVDTLVLIIQVGQSSGYSGITVAHELVHRPSRVLRTLGRIVLGGVLYEHFSTEHVRGHHARVGTPEDPATARFGETYPRFFARTVPAQLRSAWRLETDRLKIPPGRTFDVRILRSRVLQGLVAEWTFALLVLGLFGPKSFLLLLVQAFVAINLLEAVNFFEHWGLTRTGRRVEPRDSWDTDSWFSLHTLVGLSRHADHHAHASRPFQELRLWDESPKLPTGYYLMTYMVLFNSRRVVRLLTRELERRGRAPHTPAIAPTTPVA